MNTSYTNRKIKITAPGRICLFGDHQDYLGLPVIACAINREITLIAEETANDFFHILMPDIVSERRIDITETFDKLEPNDHFASALRVARRHGCIPNKGYRITLSSSIPINAGVSSSSAVIVAWIHFLLKAFGKDQNISHQSIAQLAFEAEVLEHNSPGGRMDQYTIAIGNIIYINTAKDLDYRTIGSSLNGLILAESGISKDTLGLLSNIRSKANQAIDIVKKQFPSFTLKEANLTDYNLFTQQLQDDLKPYFYAALKNHSITQKALAVFENDPGNLKEIGSLMNEHHEVLRDILKITVPKIDVIIEAALKAGAYGAKIVGSGGGGSIVALAPLGKEETIINAILESGAEAAYQVLVTRGTYAY